jgi:hypothetical protein
VFPQTSIVLLVGILHDAAPLQTAPCVEPSVASHKCQLATLSAGSQARPVGVWPLSGLA